MQDDAASFRWCREAAERGHAWALANLGWMYESGTGVEQDHRKAAWAYRRAAEAGLPEAMVWFGQMLERGRGVEESIDAAVAWYRQAAEAGNADGQYNLALCYQFGKGVEKDERAASRWYEKAAEQQHVDALYNLGWLYSQGRGVAKDIAKAKELFTTAGRKEPGEVDELIIEAMDYELGRGVRQDPAKAHMLYRKAAENGSVQAMFTVGVDYEYGRGVEKSWKEALYWYKRAATKGHPEAAFRARFRRLQAGGELIRFFRYTGTVLPVGVDRPADGKDGVIGRFGGGPPPRRRVRIRGDRFHLDTDLGDRVEVELPVLARRLHREQKITLVYAIRGGLRTGPYMMLFDHDDKKAVTVTTAREFWDRQVMGRLLSIQIFLLLSSVGLGAIFGSLGRVEKTEGWLHPFLSPFNWLVFAPLFAFVALWLRGTLRRRAQGIEAIRRRMAEIRAWVEHLPR